MGTNYYLQKDKCQHCGRSDEPLHIGKSSYGWHFSLHIIPEHNINTLDDWIMKWSEPNTSIVDEYGEIVKPSDMLDTIINRSMPDRNFEEAPYGYDSWDDFHRQNHSEFGLNGLVAHRYDAVRTDGTYDLIKHEFC